MASIAAAIHSASPAFLRLKGTIGMEIIALTNLVSTCLVRIFIICCAVKVVNLRKKVDA